MDLVRCGEVGGVLKGHGMSDLPLERRAWMPSVIDGILGAERAYREHAERKEHGEQVERTAEATESNSPVEVQSAADDDCERDRRVSLQA